MTTQRVLLMIAALTGSSLAVSTWAAGENQADGQQLQSNATVQTMPDKQGMSMRMHADSTAKGYTEQMSAMHDMHEKMLAATTPEERNALMAEQMQLMHNGMSMMGGMGTGTGNSDGMPDHQHMMEQRMDMMQSMMQMMMDRMQSVPATE